MVLNTCRAKFKLGSITCGASAVGVVVGATVGAIVGAGEAADSGAGTPVVGCTLQPARIRATSSSNLRTLHSLHTQQAVF